MDVHDSAGRKGKEPGGDPEAEIGADRYGGRKAREMFPHGFPQPGLEQRGQPEPPCGEGDR
jgi:hypothetical protein